MEVTSGMEWDQISFCFSVFIGHLKSIEKKKQRKNNERIRYARDCVPCFEYRDIVVFLYR